VAKNLEIISGSLKNFFNEPEFCPWDLRLVQVNNQDSQTTLLMNKYDQNDRNR